MRQHLAWPHLHPPGKSLAPHPVPGTGENSRSLSKAEQRQVLKDKLAVAAVLFLVLATLTVFVLYLAQQGPRFASGELSAFATPAPALAQQAAGGVPATAPADNMAGTGLGRIPLILISTVVEMGIFVALGLYLRHDMKRKP